MGSLNAHDGVVEASPDEDSCEDLVGDLDDDVGDDEGFPGVSFAGPFSDLVERSLRDEMRLNLSKLVHIHSVGIKGNITC